MADIINDNIKEQKIEMFTIAVDEGDYLTAKAIVADTREAGFDDLAAQMKEQILATPVSKWITVSPIQQYDL